MDITLAGPTIPRGADKERLHGTLVKARDAVERGHREPTPTGLGAGDRAKRHADLPGHLLLGQPGIGKTHFAKQLAKLLGTGMSLVPMSSMTAGWLLSGSSSQWKGAKPGKVFQALVEGEYANPVMVVDEIDKAASDAQYDPLGALYSLLEHDTAQSFTDEFAEVAIDASQVIWVTTANDERSIPRPILNRMNVFQIEAPDAEAALVRPALDPALDASV